MRVVASALADYSTTDDLTACAAGGAEAEAAGAVCSSAAVLLCRRPVKPVTVTVESLGGARRGPQS